MVRLLVLDIDGTLLDPSDIVTPTVRAAITQARERGVEVALATGRRLRSTRPIVEELGIRLPLVVYNGALVWSTQDESPLHQSPFTPEMLAAIAERARDVGLAPVLLQGPQHGERIVVSDPPPEAAPYIDAFVLPRRSEVEWVAFDALPQVPGVLTVDVFGPEDRLRTLTSQLAAIGLSVFHTGPLGWEADPPHWAANLHMPGVSKASGVALLASDLGVTMDQVVAVGDGENDLPLLEAAGLGVAMGNAPDALKSAADAVTRTNDEEGVRDVIERFVLHGEQIPQTQRRGRHA